MLEAIQNWAGMTILFSIAATVVGFGLATWMIVSMPQDHFLETESPPVRRHPALHVLWVIVRNVFGIGLIILGLVMAIAPGPGLLAILLGVSIVNLPGKRRVLYRCLQFRSVRRTLNWTRRKFGKPAFQFPKRTG